MVSATSNRSSKKCLLSALLAYNSVLNTNSMRGKMQAKRAGGERLSERESRGANYKAMLTQQVSADFLLRMVKRSRADFISGMGKNNVSGTDLLIFPRPPTEHLATR